MTSELIIYVLQGLLFVVLWFSKRTLNSIEEKQNETLKEVKTTNGRVTRLETEMIEHNRLDDSRFHSMEKRLDREL